MAGQSGYPARQPDSPFGSGQPQAPPQPPHGATAISAGILGLLLACLVGYVPITFFINIESGFSIGDLPARVLVYLAVFLGAASILLIGALVTFFRVLAGAILLLLGSLLAIAAILFEPTITLHGDYGRYFKVVFTLGTFDLILRAVTVVLAPLVLILAALPPTFKYLRYRTPVSQAPLGSPPRQSGHPQG